MVAVTKAWWLGFPVFRCPECGAKIQLAPGKGIRFIGHFKLPRVRRESGNGANKSRPTDPHRPTAAAKRTRKPRRDVERGVTGP